MNKFAKGSIAAAAGIVLLLGGAGSLAYWNDSADLAGTEINAGKLELTTTGAAWSDPTLEAWVPGNTNEYTAQLVLTAEGDDIRGEIAVDDTSYDLAAAAAAGFTVTVAQDGAAQVTKDGTTAPVTDELSFDGDTFTFEGPGVYTIPVSVTIELPFGAEADNDAQGVTVDFSKLAFTATQSAPAAD